MAKKTTTASVVDDKKTQPAEDTASKGKTNMSNADINIMELDTNLDDFEDFEPLPAGNYEAEIRKAELKLADSGNEYYKITYHIHPDAFPADYDKENAPEGMQLIFGRLFKVNPHDRRSVTAMKKFYKANGMSLKTSKIDPATWEGARCKLSVGVSEWNGEMRNEIKGLEAID